MVKRSLPGFSPFLTITEVLFGGQTSSSPRNDNISGLSRAAGQRGGCFVGGDREGGDGWTGRCGLKAFVFCVKPVSSQQFYII